MYFSHFIEQRPVVHYDKKPGLRVVGGRGRHARVKNMVDLVGRRSRVSGIFSHAVPFVYQAIRVFSQGHLMPPQ
jgi:hypothetical protein